MSDVTQVLLLTGSAAVVNGVYNVQRKNDPVPSLVASGIVAGSLVIFGGLIRRYDLSAALAFVFLIATLMFRGLPMLETATGLVNSPPATALKGGSTGKGSAGNSAAGGGGGGGGV